MFYIISIILVFASEVLTSDFSLLNQDYYDLNNANEIFKQFTTKFEKHYDDRSDYRFEIFKQNLDKINRWNMEEGSKTFGINQFTDMDFDEFSQKYLGLNADNMSLSDNIVFEPTKYNAPDNLDWREYGYVTSVKDQLDCGSCYVFSAIGNVEGQYAKKHNMQAFSLSNQQGLDCDPVGNCVDGGTITDVYAALAKQGGSMREEDYPYEDAKGQCRTQQDKIAVVVTGGHFLTISNEDDLKTAVAVHGPLAIALCVDERFKAYNTGNVFKPDKPCTVYNHGVLLVGYGNDGQDDYWIIKNSWDTTWGDSGYMRLVRGQYACAIGGYVTCSTVA